MPEAHISDIARVTQRAKPEPTNGHGVRRVTGSADIPITAAGEKQAEEMAAEIIHAFDKVFCGPEQRSVETAKYFSDDPIELKGLDAWARGSYEGQPADKVKAQMRSLILNPNMKPPGKSPISGQAGESFNAFLKPLMHVMRTVTEHAKSDERILLVTSGGNLQSVDELTPAGFPMQPDKDELEKIAAKPYWSATGTLFKLTSGGLKKVENNDAAGIYLCEHFKTAFNQ
jgi:hypothetical protein